MPSKECEVCWTKEEEAILYSYRGAIYCEQDLERAKEEGWHYA